MQFTARAVLTGAVLGAVLSVCNVYIGLKLPLVPNMAITAALLGYGFWRGVKELRIREFPAWGILENNISQTLGSSAALVASAGLATAVPALAALTHRTLSWPQLSLWLFSVMLVGIAVAVPLRRQMVVVDRLPFPNGAATAEMLRELYAEGAAAMRRVRALVLAGLVAALLALGTLAAGLLGYSLVLALPWSIGGLPSRSLMFFLNPNLLPVAFGGLVGFRTCWSLLAGAIVAHALLAPALIGRGTIVLPAAQASLAALPPEIVPAGPLEYLPAAGVLRFTGVMTDAQRRDLLARSSDPDFRAAVEGLYRNPYAAAARWLLWPGTALIVTGSLVSLAFAWRSILRTFRGAAGLHTGPPDPATTAEIPRGWFATAAIPTLLLSVVLQGAFFQIAWPAAVVAVLLSVALAMVAARVSGETGIGVPGPLGKVTQLAFGGLVPRSPVPNLMAANVSAGAASQCADLLDDLKCGHLLGASPRWQTLAQVLGALVGALIGSAAYLLLARDPGRLGSEMWPAPAMQSWKAVADLLGQGRSALPAAAAAAMVYAALAAVVLCLAERLSPRAWRRWLPSPVAFGLAFVMPANLALSLFVGGLLALVLRRWRPIWSRHYLLPIAAGLLAGESLTGVATAFVQALTGGH